MGSLPDNTKSGSRQDVRYHKRTSLEEDVTFHNFQYIIYDWNNFVADVGGYLGLLLGQSVYGMYEILTNCHSYRALADWLKERRRIHQ